MDWNIRRVTVELTIAVPEGAGDFAGWQALQHVKGLNLDGSHVIALLLDNEVEAL